MLVLNRFGNWFEKGRCQTYKNRFGRVETGLEGFKTSSKLDSGLSLVPRLKLNLTVHRSNASITPLDEWQLKASLIDFLKSSFSVIVPDDDLHLRKFKDAKKRKLPPVAHGNLFIRELGFLSEKKVGEWKKMVVAKMDGIELSLVGVKLG
ncbi:hypothetical protein R6Q59_006521 [Mikania micrantha]